MTKTLRHLLGESAKATGAPDVSITGVAYRSNDVSEGDVFFCIPGFAHDGHDFAPDAEKRGAAAVVVDRPLSVGIPQFVVDDTRKALASAASAFYDDPSNALAVVGITGTNGKTTTSYLIDSILKAAGKTTGLVGTVETRIKDERLKSSRTTPESLDLQALLARMRDEHVNAVTMEVSSHAIDLHRVDSVRFAVAAFSNLTQDRPGLPPHVGGVLLGEEAALQRLRGGEARDQHRRSVRRGDGCRVRGLHHCWSPAIRRHDSSSNEELGATGAVFELVTPLGSAQVRLPLAGAYNVSNALLAAGCALGLGLSLDEIVRGLETAPQVPGRLERIECGQQFSVVVDYAHTPDSLGKAIQAVKEVCSGEVIAVFGCGGDRDPDKRPLMGRAAGSGRRPPHHHE